MFITLFGAFFHAIGLFRLSVRFIVSAHACGRLLILNDRPSAGAVPTFGDRPMIAPTTSLTIPLSEPARHQLGEMLPALRRQIALQARSVLRHQREEFEANALGLACEMFQRLVHRGRAELAYSTPLATYACRPARAGRQCGGSLNVCDVTSRHCQKRNGVRGRSLNRIDPQSGRWQELIVEDRQASPADVAATRIDFQAWLETLSPQKRQIAEALASGESTQILARDFQLSAGRISQVRRELHTAWEELQQQTVPVVA